jgi:hypothetical protein
MEQLIGETWGKALMHNKSLVHIDLSNNMFNEETCKMIGQHIIKNHTIYGLHMAGNCCTVDPLGFIVLEEAITPALIEQQK